MINKAIPATLLGTILIFLSLPLKAQTVYQLSWTELDGVEENGAVLQKISTLGNAWAGAASVNELQPSTDGWFEFQLVRPINQNDFYIGFSVDNLDTSPNTIRYGLRFKANGQVDFFEGGMGRGTIANQNIGDIFKISREGINIVIYRNGVQTSSYERENDVALIADVSLTGTYSAITNATTSFDAGPGQTPMTPIPVTPPTPPTPVTGDFFKVDWTDAVGLTVDGLNLDANAPTGWNNSGAASTNRLAVGEDGWFEFTLTSPINYTNFGIGFSTENVNEHYISIRHGMLFKGNGQVDYIDGGWSRTTFANYNVGDKFRMARESTDMVLYKNGSEVRRFDKGNDTELIIDLALNSQYTGIGDVVASFGTTILPPQVDPGGEDAPWAAISGSTTDTFTTGAVAIQGSNLPAGYSLAVGGKVIAESVKVSQVANWPDYVFTSGYKLLSLEEIKKFVEEHGHLPGFPSQRVVKAEGVELLEMNQKLLEKVEELTLHLIKQNEMLKKQQAEIEALKKRIED